MNVLVLGASGRLGRALIRLYGEAGHTVQALSHKDLDLSHPESIAPCLEPLQFDLMINAAGLTDVDFCEAHPGLAETINSTAPGVLAAECAQRGARLVQVSTDYVFPGSGRKPLTEDQPPEPLNVYGRSKLGGEQAVLAADPQALVLRVAWLFGHDKPSFPDRILRQAEERLDISAVNDKWSSPTYADDVAGWLMALLRTPDTRGLFHLCNSGVCSWQEYGEETLAIAARLGLPVKTTRIRGHTMEGFAPFLAKRPPYTPLDTSRFTAATGVLPRTWQQALAAYLEARYHPPYTL